jgi:hypothetical protein
VSQVTEKKRRTAAEIEKIVRAFENSGLKPATRIYFAVRETDMRKGFDGLYGLVRDRLQ